MAAAKVYANLTWKSQKDPKKRFPREDKSIRLMADIKTPVREDEKPS